MAASVLQHLRCVPLQPGEERRFLWCLKNKRNIALLDLAREAHGAWPARLVVEGIFLDAELQGRGLFTELLSRMEDAVSAGAIQGVQSLRVGGRMAIINPTFAGFLRKRGFVADAAAPNTYVWEHEGASLECGDMQCVGAAERFSSSGGSSWTEIVSAEGSYVSCSSMASSDGSPVAVAGQRTNTQGRTK